MITFDEFIKAVPDWKEKATEMFSEGDAEINVIVALGLTRKVHARFCTDYNEYADVITRGKEMSEAWWTAQGKRGLTDKTFQTGFYAFNMKNRFQWRDTPLAGGDGVNPLGDKDDEEKTVQKYSKGGSDEKEIGSIIQ